MRITQIVFREIMHRRSNFFLSCFSVSIAVSFIICSFAVLNLHDLRTNKILTEKISETKKSAAALKNDMRKITKKMGFNVLILPEKQSLDDFYSDNYATQLMPEEYVKKLAASRAVTIRHLLPTLEQKIRWPEEKRTIILIGVRGEIPFLYKTQKKPIEKTVKPGTVVAGHLIAQKLNLKKGSEIAFMGKKFTVVKIHKERGSRDDISLWMDLKEAQKLTGKEGKINGILALECKCAWANLKKVRTEIKKILPDTKVISFAGKAEARKAARIRAETAAAETIRNIQSTSRAVRTQISKSADILIPIVIAAAALLIAFFAYSNTCERRYEIGIMRAVGISSSKLFSIFILRALVIAIVGFIDALILSIIVCICIGSFYYNLKINAVFFKSILQWRALTGAIVFTPLLVICASWIPALKAVTTDPAEILREE